MYTIYEYKQNYVVIEDEQGKHISISYQLADAMKHLFV